MPKLKIKEAEIQKTILEWLARKKYFCYRQNTGGFKTDSGHFYRFGTLGAPDIICVIKGRYVGIEVKGTGGKQNPAQIEFQRCLEKAGGKYIVAKSIEDVEKVLKL